MRKQVMIGSGTGTEQKHHGRGARATGLWSAFFIIVSVLIIASLICVAVLSTRDAAGPTPMTNPVGMVDRLDFFDTPAAWSAGKLERLSLDPTGPARLALHDPRND